MDFIDQLKNLAKRIENLKPQITTEEATKTSMVMPFFQILGYDVFNPSSGFKEPSIIFLNDIVSYNIVSSGLVNATLNIFGRGTVLFSIKESRTWIDKFFKFLKENVPTNTAPLQQNTNTVTLDDLPKLKQLLDSGVITQDEFDAAKKKVLG